jgi:hypothetical protein
MDGRRDFCKLRTMKQINDGVIARRMLEKRERGHSLALFLRWNARRYLLLFACFGLALVIAGMLRLWMPFYWVLGMLMGCVVRDLGWFRANGRTWPFTLKVMNWDEVQRLAEERKDEG